jgi:hypothetical protein
VFIFVKPDKVLEPDIKTFMYTVGILQFGCIIDQHMTRWAVPFPSNKLYQTQGKRNYIITNIINKKCIINQHW